MRPLILNIVFSFIFTSSLSGQNMYSVVEKNLQILFSGLHAKGDIERLQVNDSIRLLVAEYAESDSVFNHSFTGLKYLGQITSADSLLKIIGWNLILDNYRGKYYTYLIRKGADGQKNLIIPLEASYNTKPMRTDTTYIDREWYGALYYSIKPYADNGEECWVVLGLDYGNPSETRKVIDVISFDNGSAVFGKKWFETPHGMNYRVVFEYASTGMMTLRFNSENSILFDHLVPINTGSNVDKVFYGPDYSYDTYLFEEGTWRLKLNVDARNKE